MENNGVLSHTEPLVTGEKCQGYAEIAGDMTEPYCQVSGYTMRLLSLSSTQAMC